MAPFFVSYLTHSNPLYIYVNSPTHYKKDDTRKHNSAYRHHLIFVYTVATT